MGKVAIPSDFAAARGVERVVLEQLAKHGYDEAEAFAVKLAMEEGLSNAIRHGNHCDPGKKVRVHFDVDDRRVALTIADEGEGFDPDSLPDPTTDENLEKPSGRGVMLMLAYMDEVQYSEHGSKVHMVKHKS